MKYQQLIVDDARYGLIHWVFWRHAPIPRFVAKRRQIYDDCEQEIAVTFIEISDVNIKDKKEVSKAAGRAAYKFWRTQGFVCLNRNGKRFRKQMLGIMPEKGESFLQKKLIGNGKAAYYPPVTHPNGGLIKRSFWLAAPMLEWQAERIGGEIWESVNLLIVKIAQETQTWSDIRELSNFTQRQSYAFWKKQGWKKVKTGKRVVWQFFSEFCPFLDKKE